MYFMHKIFENRYIDALAKTILFFAGVHLVILMFHALSSFTFDPLNVFAILDLELFVPGISTGSLSFALSIILLSLVYGVILRFWTRRK